jgi:hypothetical protein
VAAGGEVGGRERNQGSDTKLDNETLTLMRVARCINRLLGGPSPLQG